MKANCLKKITANERGFTLIEILVAITIFAVGMLAVASMQISGIQGNATANALTGASTWAADRIERLMNLDYDSSDLAHGSTGTDSQGRYAIEWTVTEHAPLNNIKTIQVRVQWEDRGRNRELRYTYYKADV